MDSRNNQTSILFKSGGLSLFLLIVFLYLQYKDSKILLLDEKWILVSTIPLILGLLISNIIKSFKGFGIEIETVLNQKLDYSLFNNVTPLEKPKLTKGSSDILRNLSPEKIKDIKRIQFIYKQKDYYDAQIVLNYFNKLKNLQYIEIINEEGYFKSLLNINQIYKKDSNENYQKIQAFIRSIENGTVLFDYNCITDTISKNDNLLIVYQKFQNFTESSNLFNQILPVLKDRKMIGTISRCKVTDNIAKIISDKKQHTLTG